MKQFLVLTRKDLLEITRSKKMLILIFVFLFVAIASPLLAKLTPLLLKSIPSTPGLTINLPDPTYKEAIDQFVKNIQQIGMIVLVFIVAGSIVDEKNRKNLEILLSKPVARTKFILSKFASYLAPIALMLIISAIIFYFYTNSIFGAFSLSNFSIMSVLLLLNVLMILSITMLASTFTRNALSAAGIGYAIFIFIDIIFGLVRKITKYSPNYTFSNYKTLISDGWNGDFILPMLITLSITIVSVILSVALFRNQEIER